SAAPERGPIPPGARRGAGRSPPPKPGRSRPNGCSPARTDGSPEPLSQQAQDEPEKAENRRRNRAANEKSDRVRPVPAGELPIRAGKNLQVIESAGIAAGFLQAGGV